MENVDAAMTVLAVIRLWTFASFYGRNGLSDLGFAREISHGSCTSGYMDATVFLALQSAEC